MAHLSGMQLEEDINIFDNIQSNMEIDNKRQSSPCDKETAARQRPPPRPKETTQPKLVLNIRRDETGHHRTLEEEPPPTDNE
ncbi:hypothetical protein PUN28_013962 [Cardiocondyla obscurior]|uniref:Uncharacterized protein n=1 Tax=Cardiocondyla obscurior TaxID=286306 RepID=A0AAW2F3W4_9HYME